jgi:hypothetical protein
MLAHLVVTFSTSTNRSGGPVRVDQSEGQPDRRVADVGPAQVEGPGDRIQRRKHRRVGVLLASQSATACLLSALDRPASRSGWTLSAALLGSGRSLHTVSSGLASTAHQSAPLPASASRVRSTQSFR